MELVYPKEVPVFEKYDEYVPDELIKKGFAYGVLDIEGMKARIMSWASLIRSKGPVVDTGLLTRKKLTEVSYSWRYLYRKHPAKMKEAPQNRMMVRKR